MFKNCCFCGINSNFYGQLNDILIALAVNQIQEIEDSLDWNLSVVVCFFWFPHQILKSLTRGMKEVPPGSIRCFTKGVFFYGFCLGFAASCRLSAATTWAKRRIQWDIPLAKLLKKRLLTSKYFTVQLLLRQNANELKK